MYLSKPIDCTPQRVNPNVIYELQLIVFGLSIITNVPSQCKIRVGETVSVWGWRKGNIWELCIFCLIFI